MCTDHVDESIDTSIKDERERNLLKDYLEKVKVERVETLYKYLINALDNYFLDFILATRVSYVFPPSS